MATVRDASDRRNSIGVAFQWVGVRGAGITDAFLEGLAIECSKNKLGQVLSLFRSPAEFHKFVTGPAKSMVDGFIVAGVFHQELVSDMIRVQAEGFPVVTAYAHPVHRSLVNIGADQVGISRVATEHLLDQGCREIVHLRASDARLVGYRQALRSRGLAARPEWVYHGQAWGPPLMAPGGEEAIAHFLNEGVSFDGVVSSSDHQAMGAIRALLKAGRRVPEDVKVIGVDNSPLCECGFVTLSSVSDDIRLRGRLAVRALMGRLRDRSVKSMSLEPVLYPRESTATTAASAD